MISVGEAFKIILQNTFPVRTELIPAEHATGRVLQEEIFADRDFPPFDRVTMDGIAIAYDAFQKGRREFSVEGRHLAGSPEVSLNDANSCLEVMTGAILPQGTDTVIRYEDVEITDGKARILIEEINTKQNIHRQGIDRKSGDLLIKPGTLISPAEIGVLTTVGKTEVQVAAVPKIAIISTGDELVDVDQTPEPHQIRKSNVYNLRSALEIYGGIVELHHIADNKSETIRRIDEISGQYDVLILSGGVSRGKADYVPEALEQLGHKKLFHRIKQRPGKPFWFGSKGDQVVFAFPGNPVSTFLCYQKYFIPWMSKCLGLDSHKPIYAALSGEVNFKPALTYFLQVKISSDQKTGQLLAEPVEGHGSGDLANLLDSDAFLELPDDRDQFHPGEVYPFISFK